MWGRGSYGGGGFGAYKALECIDPKKSSLSVAIFGQAWSWESQEDGPEWTWKRWWERDRLLWLGQGTPNHNHDTMTTFNHDKTQFVPGAYSTELQSIPLASYFSSSPPPPPDILPFHSTFSPGVGHAFFVEGERHLESPKGWTDLDKQTSLGSLVWPAPMLLVESADPNHLIHSHSHLARVSLCFEDAWLGGSSLNVTIARSSVPIPGKDVPTRFFIPIERLGLLPNSVYNYRIVWKSSDTSVVKPFVKSAEENSALPMTMVESVPLANGWEELKNSLVIQRSEDDSRHYVEVEIGIEVLFSESANVVEPTLYLGQISVSLESLKPPPRILSLEWIPADDSASMLNGTLEWDLHQGRESDDTSSWAYFLVFTHNDVGITPQHPILIGSTVGNITEFDVVQVPREAMRTGGGVTHPSQHPSRRVFSQRVFFIRGVTLAGELSTDRHFSIV